MDNTLRVLHRNIIFFAAFAEGVDMLFGLAYCEKMLEGSILVGFLKRYHIWECIEWIQNVLKHNLNIEQQQRVNPS